MRRPPLLLACRLALVAGLLQVGPLLAQDSVPAQPDSAQPGSAEPDSAQPDSAEPPARVARVAYLQGEVSFQPAGDTAWSPATLNYPLTTGDRLFAGADARAEVQFGPCTVRLAEYADVTLVDLTDHLLQLGVTQGTVRVSVYELGPADSLEVDTPHGALVLRAPGEYRVDAAQGDSALAVSAEGGGSLQWTAGGVAQTVATGQAILVSGVDPISVASVTPPVPDAFDRWSAARDASVAASATARYVSRDIPGYQDLDGAGSWQVDGTYGPVWYPNAIPVGWVPYRYGRWVWVPPWGWTWVENAHWGYAPFHYGRWIYLRSRWGWVPGPLVAHPYYAPALVVFVDGPGIGPDAQGWFPLGPGEPYYPWYPHDQAYLRRVNITNMRQLRDPAILNDASFLNRIQYRNREQGTTVVPAAAFRSGESLVHRVIRARPAEITAARIAPSALVKPTPRERTGVGPLAERRPPAPRRPGWIVAPAPAAAPAATGRPLVVPRAEPGPRAGPVLIARTPPPAGARRPVPQPEAAPVPGRELGAPQPQPGSGAEQRKPAEQPPAQPAAKPRAHASPSGHGRGQEKGKERSDSSGRRGPGD